MPQAGTELFLLGLACGIALFAATAYRRITPRWLRLLLMASSLFVASRYIAMALFTMDDAPARFWGWHRCWFAATVGLTLPSAFAVDHVLRHPAMTPAKLLRWYAPFLAVYGAIILAGQASPVQDAVGWVPQLSPAWQGLLSVTQGIFTAGFIGLSLLFFVKVPVAPIRIALLGLASAHGYLALNGPFAETLVVLAIWFAFDTGSRLH